VPAQAEACGHIFLGAAGDGRPTILTFDGAGLRARRLPVGAGFKPAPTSGYIGDSPRPCRLPADALPAAGIAGKFIHYTPLFLFFEVFQKLPDLHPQADANMAVHAPVGIRLVNLGRQFGGAFG